MTVRLGISVEGQTEERFVKDLLADHLQKFDIYVTPVLVSPGRNANGTKASDRVVFRGRQVGSTGRRCRFQGRRPRAGQRLALDGAVETAGAVDRASCARPHAILG